MKTKKLLLCFISVMTISMISCNLNPTNPRLFVVQEIKLNGGYSLFWFRDDRQITHNGLSYFQFAKEKCELSPLKANAYCHEPVQIYDIKEDTVFLLTHTEIVPVIPDTRFNLKTINYSIDLYDRKKSPKKEEQFFLDSLCKQQIVEK